MPKTVTWVLETNVFAEVCFDAMIAHFEARGIPYETVRIIPFAHTVEGKTPALTGPVVVYGSIGIQKLADAQGWTCFHNSETFSSSAYKVLGDLFLNHDTLIMPLSDVLLRLDELPDPFFIKPDGDYKEFAGQVISKADFTTWLENMNSIGYLADNNFDVAVAPVKELACEWRVVVVDGKISSASLYKNAIWPGMPAKPVSEVPAEVRSVVEAAHALHAPAPVYVIDIAEVYTEPMLSLTRTGLTQIAHKVIEYNTFNSAGLYACDVAKIIDDVNTYMLKPPPEPRRYETFSDPAYFDMICVRPRGFNDFNETIHVVSQKQADALVDQLTSGKQTWEEALRADRERGDDLS